MGLPWPFCLLTNTGIVMVRFMDSHLDSDLSGSLLKWRISIKQHSGKQISDKLSDPFWGQWSDFVFVTPFGVSEVISYFWPLLGSVKWFRIYDPLRGQWSDFLFLTPFGSVKWFRISDPLRGSVKWFRISDPLRGQSSDFVFLTPFGGQWSDFVFMTPFGGQSSDFVFLTPFGGQWSDFRRCLCSSRGCNGQFHWL
jgi:hypothetical protein